MYHHLITVLALLGVLLLPGGTLQPRQPCVCGWRCEKVLPPLWTYNCKC